MKLSKMKKLFAENRLESATINANDYGCLLVVTVVGGNCSVSLERERGGLRVFASIEAAWKLARQVGFQTVTLIESEYPK